jgi:hypothetical protein
LEQRKSKIELKIEQPEEIPGPSGLINKQENESRPHFKIDPLCKSMKLMSTLLKEQKTPKNIRGVEIDEKQKIRFSAKK